MKRLLTVLVVILAIAPTRGEAFPAEIPDGIVLPEDGLAVSHEEVACLALNDYFEARGESMRGRVAVAQVVLNRARDERFPRNLCDVIAQNLSGQSFACQFSWTCDGRSDEPVDMESWKQSIFLAIAVTRVTNGISDPTGGAMWYHADFVQPGWSARLAPSATIGAHVFYTEEPAEIRLAAQDDGSRAFGAIAPPPPTFAEWAQSEAAMEQIAQR